MSDFTVRPAAGTDAAALLALQHALDGETAMMMLEPGERTATVADVTAHLTAVEAQPNCAVLVAAAGGPLVGYVEAVGESYRRSRHRRSRLGHSPRSPYINRPATNATAISPRRTAQGHRRVLVATATV